MIQGEGFFSVEFRSSRNIILIDNGQWTMDNYCREEGIYFINTFVPDCIIIYSEIFNL